MFHFKNKIKKRNKKEKQIKTLTPRSENQTNTKSIKFCNQNKDKDINKITEEEGPKWGFSLSGWMENLPRNLTTLLPLNPKLWLGQLLMHFLLIFPCCGADVPSALPQHISMSEHKFYRNLRGFLTASFNHSLEFRVQSSKFRVINKWFQFMNC